MQGGVNYTFHTCITMGLKGVSLVWQGSLVSYKMF